MAEQEETRERILRAALEEFIANGKTGARMQSIADRAGVNKAMLHYYFTNKDQLHAAAIEHVFRSAISDIVGHALSEGVGGPEFIRRFVDDYFNFLRRNPEFPRLLIWEIAAGNEDFLRRMKQFLHGITPAIPETAITILRRSIDKGEIYPYDPTQLMISILALVLFYFIGRPMVKIIFEQEVDEDEFLDSRENHVKTLILRAIMPEGKEGSE